MRTFLIWLGLLGVPGAALATPATAPATPVGPGLGALIEAHRGPGFIAMHQIDPVAVAGTQPACVRAAQPAQSGALGIAAEPCANPATPRNLEKRR